MSPAVTYRVNVTRVGRFWAIEVPELRGGHTQGRWRGEVELMARELIGIILDVDPDSVSIDVHYEGEA